MLTRKRVPVYCGADLIELAGLERVTVLLRAANAVAVRARGTGAIAAVELLDYGGDWRYKCLWNNPRKDVLKSETDYNPPNVWAFKKLTQVTQRFTAGKTDSGEAGNSLRYRAGPLAFGSPPSSVGKPRERGGPGY